MFPPGYLGYAYLTFMPDSNDHLVTLQHSFLFQIADWQVTGELLNQQGCVIPLQGYFRIRHQSGKWLEYRDIPLHYNAAQQSTYQAHIRPFSPTLQHTHWFVTASCWGALSGIFALEEDAILSRYQSRDLHYSGTEYFRRVAMDHYINRGVIFRAGQRYQSWSIQLSRMPASP